MPLLDHFHPPLSIERYWHGFHNGWASEIAAQLNERLPPRYFAQPNVHFGIEVDIGAFDVAPIPSAPTMELAGVAPGATAWQPAQPTQTLELAIVTDIVEVQVYQEGGGPVLVAAIELVSPANKDRPAHRDAFVAKCMTYLRQGVSLIIVDIVTDRHATLHDDLVARAAVKPSPRLQAPLYATAYRPVERDHTPMFDVWVEALAVGTPLPDMPLWLPGDVVVPVELESSYARTCRAQRITV